jgi:hypothetical protein
VPGISLAYALFQSHPYTPLLLPLLRRLAGHGVQQEVTRAFEDNFLAAPVTTAAGGGGAAASDHSRSRSRSRARQQRRPSSHAQGGNGGDALKMHGSSGPEGAYVVVTEDQQQQAEAEGEDSGPRAVRQLQAQLQQFADTQQRREEGEKQQAASGAVVAGSSPVGPAPRWTNSRAGLGRAPAGSPDCQRTEPPDEDGATVM